ncbi:oxidoreductase [bacterium]|nr:oxidoreductase [bacterium]MDC1241003.1 oxidoreductase [bacterium]
MSETFRALRLNKSDDGITHEFVDLTENDLMEGNVTVKVSHSTVNFKDGLALNGAVVRVWPMIPGIDFTGTVESSDHADFKAGDEVVLNGWGVSETHFGGFSQKARVNGDWLVKRPSAISASRAMAIGTAGYTAMLSVMAIEAGVNKDDGEILVTGAAGGVGSVAIALLSKLGYTVVASTGRMEETEYLTSLGASRVIDRAVLSGEGRPLDKENWAGVVDCVGSHTLANAISQTRYGGTVTACGLAQGADLPGTVMPFILRSVSLRGIDSVMAPKALREEAWARLAKDLDMEKLDAMSVYYTLQDVPELGPKILAGQVRGRVVIDVNA